MRPRHSVRRSLPSLSALAALEAATRTRSFIAAARELNVTATAISHQIRGLEQLYGNKLFIRKNRRVEPTETAKIALFDLQEGFSILARAVEQIRDRASGDVVPLRPRRIIRKRSGGR